MTEADDNVVELPDLDQLFEKVLAGRGPGTPAAGVAADLARLVHGAPRRRRASWRGTTQSSPAWSPSGEAAGAGATPPPGRTTPPLAPPLLPDAEAATPLLSDGEAAPAGGERGAGPEAPLRPAPRAATGPSTRPPARRRRGTRPATSAG